MSKRTLALIAALILVTGLLLLIALSQKAPMPLPVAPTPTPTPVPVAQTQLSLVPNLLSISSPSATINVNLASGNNKVTAVQLELIYDPKLLTIVDIAPGAFFENPIVLLKNIDVKNGRISYAIAIPIKGVAKKGTGTVATITFTTQMAQGQQTQIQFLPKTLVTAEGVSASVLKESQGATILVSPLPKTTTP